MLTFSQIVEKITYLVLSCDVDHFYKASREINLNPEKEAKLFVIKLNSLSTESVFIRCIETCSNFSF